MNLNEPRHTGLDTLLRLACTMGASDARAIASDQIGVQERLAEYCLNPGCENYGLSMSCPPHVSGPSGFRRIQQNLQEAIAVRIAVPSAVLFSDERWEIFRLLHEIVAAVEQAAVEMGYSKSQGFAGGSCKRVFCRDHADCRVLSQDDGCRHPQFARPSMSGFGIDVAGLMKRCGWPADIAAREAGAGAGAMSWVAGLIMLG